MLQRPIVHVKTMEASKIMEDVDTTATNPVSAFEEDVAHKTTGIGTEAVVVEPTVILHITDGHTECVPIQIKTAGPQKMAVKRAQYDVTICRAVKETAPDRSGR